MWKEILILHEFYLNQHLSPKASLALYVLEYGVEQWTLNFS